MSETGWRYKVRKDGSIFLVRGDPEHGPHIQFDFYGDEETARMFTAAPALAEALEELVNAKALAEVRDQVAGWNGENQPDGPYKERHPNKLGATIPKTNCGAIYALDEAMQKARAALKRARGQS